MAPPSPRRPRRKPGDPYLRPDRARSTEHARKAANARKKSDIGKKHGVPAGWHWKDYEVEKQRAQEEGLRIYKIMEKNGQLPTDEIAREALLAVLQMMREPNNKDMKHKLARTLLEYTHAKPTAKQDVTVRTAEDFLDELVSKGGDG